MPMSEKTKKVLLVDDQDPLRVMTRILLERRFPHAQFDEASDGAVALDRMVNHRYDLVISDWKMPNISGYDLLLWLRDNPLTKNIPFFMVTSVNDERLISKAVAAGANDYIIKPFAAEVLLDKVAAAVGDGRQFKRVHVDGTARVYFDDKYIGGAIADVSEGGMLGEFIDSAVLPGLNASVTLDISLREFLLKSLKASVHRVRGKNQQTTKKQFQIAFKFMNPQPELLSH